MYHVRQHLQQLKGSTFHFFWFSVPQDGKSWAEHKVFYKTPLEEKLV